MLVLLIGLVTVFMFKGRSTGSLVPNRWQLANEMLVGFVENIAVDNAGKEAMKYFPLIFTLFVFVLFANLIGMIPTAFTVTSHIIVTFAMAGILFAAITLLGFIKHGPRFLSMFLPSGTPLWLAPLMIVIEIISYFARPISLSIRLAANMIAGHVMMKIIAGFIVPLAIFGIGPLIFLILLTGFEIFIACLQAYVFTLLTCVYLNDALHLH